MHKAVCKHYDYICRNPELIFIGCTLKEVKKSTDKSSTNPSVVKPAKPGNDNVTLLKVVKNENKEEKEVENKYEPPELKICPTCNGKIYGDIYKCDECGVPICDCCAFYGDSIVDPDGGMEIEKRYCDKCYEKLFKEEIEKDVDNSSIFDILTSELNEEEDDDGSR